MKVVVLHEYGANSHYNALEYLCRNNDIEIKYREFRPFYQLLKSIYKQDFILFKKSIINFIFIFSSIIGLEKNTTFVIGIAPYNWRIVLVYLITFRSRYFLHTSWPFWNGNYQPHRAYSFLKSLWSKVVYNSQGVFCVTDRVRQSVLETFVRFERKRLHVVYHSLDESFLKAARNVRRSKFSECEKIRAIFIGRLDNTKGFDVILDLASDKMAKNIEISVVGDGYLKNDPRISKVNFIGYIGDRNKLAQAICSNDILLLPSRKTEDWQELFGMVIIEALACGVYPVVTEHLGPKELIGLTDGKLISEDILLDDLKALVVDLKSKKINLDRQALINFGEVFSVDEISKKWEPILNVS